MGVGGFVATVGAVTVMLMAMSSSAGAQAGDLVDDVQEDAVAEIQNASMAAEVVVQDADALKNDTMWTAVDTVLDAYGTVVKKWPKSTPEPPAEIREVPILGELAGRGTSIPSPPDLEDKLQPRSQPGEETPAPPPEKEVRKTVDEVTTSPTDTTSAPEPPRESNTTGDNETLVEKPTPPERGSIPYAETGGSPEPAARPPADEDAPAPLGMAASEAGRVPVPGVVVFAAAGLALGAVVAWLLTQTRFLGRVAGGSAVALFSRQTGKEVLQSPVRARIHAAVTHESGITFTKLRQALDMPPSTLRYHLAILRREDLIKVTRRGRTLHYHGGAARVDGQAQAREYLFWRGRGSIVSAILRHPGANQQAVARLAGLPASRVSVYTRELAEAGLVRSERVGRCRTYYPTARLEEMKASGRLPTPS